MHVIEKRGNRNLNVREIGFPSRPQPALTRSRRISLTDSEHSHHSGQRPAGELVTFRRIPANTPCKSDQAMLTYDQMVVLRKEREEALNQLFRALADGTRRDILARSFTETPSVCGGGGA